MPALSAACVSLAVASSSPRIAISWKSNSRSVSPRKRQTGRRSMRIIRALSRVREEERLPPDAIAADRLLPRWREEPVDEALALRFLHVRVFRRIHEHDAVLVEELAVAFHQDREAGA